VLQYWRDRDAGVGPKVAVRRLADSIKTDTLGWLQVSAQEFSQALPINFGQDRIRRIEQQTGRRSGERATTIDATRRHRHSLVPLDPSDWRRLAVRSGRLHACDLPPLSYVHPALRKATTAVPYPGNAAQPEQAWEAEAAPAGRLR
jgi:hypothetical protein